MKAGKDQNTIKKNREKQKGKIFAGGATQVKFYISLCPMLKKQLCFIINCVVAILFIPVAPVASHNIIDTVSAQSQLKTPDTLNIATDSLLLADTDSLNHVLDSTLIDSLSAVNDKWDFKTIGGNDSTYYSFYGHLFNIDDTNLVETWIYNSEIHEPEIYNYDSTLLNFHKFHPAYRKTINNSYLGNTGSAVKSNIFAEPNPKTGFIFMNSYTPYMFLSNKVPYYNVLKPFTIFKVNIGPQEEQNIEILHTQNINRYFNAFIRFKNYTGKGNYIRQETRNNAGTIGATYTKGRLATHFNYVFNRIEAQENGGIIDNYMVTDTSISTNEINTRLTDGLSFVKDRQMFFDQKIGFLKTNVPDSAQLGAYWFSFQYTYNRHKSKKIYTDLPNDYFNPITKDTLNLYANNFSGGPTFDSTYYFYRNHNFRLNLEENPKSYPFVGAFFGYGMQTTDYYYFNKDILFDNTHSNTLNSSYFEAGIFRLKGKKFKFSGNYKLYISGYHQGNMQLNGFISQKFGKTKKQFELKGYGGIYIETPDYFLTQYYSNHYRWNNNFSAKKRTSLNFSFSYPYYKTQIGSRFNLITDYIYFNTDAVPAQYNKTLSVFDIYLNNVFEFWKFGLNTKLNYQQTDNNEILPLPEFSGYAAFYWKPNVYFKDTGGKLRFQLGVDAYYWTSYYGQAYSPALARFYNQKEQLIGDYPFVGIFWNVEIKRLRFYLRYEHANYGLTTPRNYFLAPNYPSNRSTVRYGIAWTFYD